MRRNFRSAKFAEYLSTYAILHHVGLHQTLVIEQRDASRGIGLYVRDAVDAGTDLIVLPPENLITSQSLASAGVPCDVPAFQSAYRANHTTGLEWDGSLTSALLGGVVEPSDFLVLLWQLAVELSARHSTWWGWLASVPQHKTLLDWARSAKAQSAVTRPDLAAQCAAAYDLKKQECSAATQAIETTAQIVPPPNLVGWSYELLLSRSLMVDRFDRSLQREASDQVAAPTLALAPFLDLCNASRTNHGVNADVCLLDSAEQLPAWYTSSQEFADYAKRPASTASRNYDTMVLTTTKPLLPGDEVLISYWTGDPGKLLATLPASRATPSDADEIAMLLRYHIPMTPLRRR